MKKLILILLLFAIHTVVPLMLLDIILFSMKQSLWGFIILGIVLFEFLFIGAAYMLLAGAAYYSDEIQD